MIKIGNTKIDVKHFPDGTQMLLDCDIHNWNHSLGYYMITWNYESDEELLTLIYLVNHIRKTWQAAPIYLFMPYIPNARMDRTKNPGEVFTLKYFANIINGLHFDKVFVLDPHSDVSTALIDRVSVVSIEDYLASTIQVIKDRNHIECDDDIMIYFPDAGAYKRYKDLGILSAYEKIYGQNTDDSNILYLLQVNAISYLRQLNCLNKQDRELFKSMQKYFKTRQSKLKALIVFILPSFVHR
jgi:ribose-phosphate pyrophosphokinase